MTITKTLFAGALCAMACRQPSDVRPTEQIERPARVEPERRDPATAGVPTDFSIELGGGPVAASMAANMTLERTRIEPRPGSPGEFDVVLVAISHDEMGHETTTRELRRAPIPVARIDALHRIVRERREELRAPCMDPSIMDGAVRRVLVHADGSDEQFTCVNASTPAFDALTIAYDETVRQALGS
jgi:hypothetical protein